jgi:orotidine-5'-phosphate decarboxylase
VARTGARFLTVHAVGQVMRAAREGAAGSKLELLGVTVLTSFGPADMEEQGYVCAISDLVERRARLAMTAGIDGIVASPLEAAAVRRVVGPKKIIVTPGVRSAGSARGDQQRVATPAEALRNGADYLVMGRQITRAADPAGEMARVLEEIGKTGSGW